MDPLKTMGPGARLKYHGFHVGTSMFFLLAWDRETVKNFHMIPWDMKPWGTIVDKNKSMGSTICNCIDILKPIFNQLRFEL